MRKLLTLLALLAVMAAQGAVLGRHLSINLRQENIPVEQTTQYFSKWVKTDDKTTFTLIKDETDDLGFRHQRYEQQYGGIKVDAACLIVHSKNGKLTHVNGFVMEAKAAPARQLSRRTAVSHNLVLVEIPEGFVYAIKNFDPVAHEIVYTDVETGKVVKRLPTTFHFNDQTKVKGTSYYYGEKEMDATRLSDCYILTDSVRKIYTYDAANAPDTIAKKYCNLQDKDEKGNIVYFPDSANCNKYFNEVLPLAQTKRSSFKMQELTQLKLNLTDAGREKMQDGFYTMIITCGDVTIHQTVGLPEFPKVIYPEKEKTTANYYHYIRMNDTDTTWVTIVSDTSNDIFDVLRIAPTADGGDVVSMKENGAKGFVTAEATLKACGNYAVDTHWGMQCVYDFYKDVLGRNSYDGYGAQIINVINPRHVTQSVNPMISMPEANAYADHSSMPRMVYGRGNLEEKSDEQVELSTMGHEFTHLVTWKTANLENIGEPGGLNEAFSDIFGAAIVNKWLNADGSRSLNYVYAIGQDSERNTEGGCMRLMKDPWVKKDPKALYGKYWVDTNNLQKDYGGIHSNCNVLDFWFYLLSEGFQSGRDVLDDTIVDPEFIESVKTTGWKGIGVDKSIKIVYRLLTHYLYPKADFRATYDNSKSAAMDLGYDENSTEYQTMMKCWRAVTPAGWTDLIMLTGTIDFSYTAKTVKEFKDNNTKLVNYSGTDLKSGLVELTATFTLTKPETLRQLTTIVPKYLPAICHVNTLTAKEKAYDFTEGFKDFLGKVLADPKAAAGYSLSYTKTDTIRGGCTADITTDILSLNMNKTDKVTIKEDPATTIAEGKLNITTNDVINLSILMTSGYPIAAEPSISIGETIYINLFRVGANGQETPISNNNTPVDFNDNKIYSDTKGKYFAEWFTFQYPQPDELGLAEFEPIPAGTYRLQLYSTWTSLAVATFNITVAEATGIENVQCSMVNGQYDGWYTLDGRRLSSRPTAKGLYIHHGKKVIVK